MHILKVSKSEYDLRLRDATIYLILLFLLLNKYALSLIILLRARCERLKM